MLLFIYFFHTNVTIRFGNASGLWYDRLINRIPNANEEKIDKFDNDNPFFKNIES